MPIFKNSRYRKVGKHQITDASDTSNEVFDIRTTTLEAPKTTRTYTVQQGDTLQSLGRELLGSPELWWVLADLNPLATFYPLSLPVGTELIIPTMTFAGLQR